MKNSRNARTLPMTSEQYTALANQNLNNSVAAERAGHRHAEEGDLNQAEAYWHRASCLRKIGFKFARLARRARSNKS